MIKKIFLSVLLCTVYLLSMAQSQTVTHVVQRGETLESIAEYYKVSVEDINKANPNAYCVCGDEARCTCWSDKYNNRGNSSTNKPKSYN